MKYKELISRMSLEEKCYLFSGKDFWQSRSVQRLGVPNMTMSDGPHGIRKQEGAGDQLGLNGSCRLPVFRLPQRWRIHGIQSLEKKWAGVLVKKPHVRMLMSF